MLLKLGKENRERGTGVWERVHSGDPKNSSIIIMIIIIIINNSNKLLNTDMKGKLLTLGRRLIGRYTNSLFFFF